MPFINTISTVEITEEKKAALTAAFGKAIALIPGKSESWLMLNFIGSSKMAFRGDGVTDCAMLEVEILGKASDEAFDNLTRELCSQASTILGVPSDRIYVKYRECDRWGYDGSNF